MIFIVGEIEVAKAFEINSSLITIRGSAGSWRC